MSGRYSAMALADRLLRAFAWLVFKALNDIQIEGEENVPAEGAVILASNHPSYLDPAFIMIGLRRHVRFLAWEKPFQIPVLGWLLRRYGAIPLNIERPGRASFEAAVRVLRSREAFGIFPEGGRSDFGSMKPLKSGVARLAMMTGAPIVPVTIRGAFRVWPKHQFLPQPGWVGVVFHPPIRLESARLAARHGGSPDDPLARDREYEETIVKQVMEAINAALLPAIRAEQRQDEVYETAIVPWTWTSDAVPLFCFIALGLTSYFKDALLPPSALLWGGGYVIYVALDSMLRLPGAWAKGLRARAPWLLLGLMALAEARGFAGAAVVLAAYLALTWYQSFRFQSYRRVRGPLLFAAYAAWFFHVFLSLS